ncbi:MAG: hypothetical protein ACRD1R_18000 [Acidobacteriota bacterium]
MATTRRIKQRQEREFFAHHMLLHVAYLELEIAKVTELGRFNHCLVAMTFSALAIEALANAVGSRAIDEWSDFESASPLAKVRLLAERLSITYRSTKEPWATLRYLMRFRNAIAHAKPKRILEEKVMQEAEYNSQLFRKPPSKMEREITLGNATRCFEAVHTLRVVHRRLAS